MLETCILCQFIEAQHRPTALASLLQALSESISLLSSSLLFWRVNGNERGILCLKFAMLLCE